MWIVQFGEKKNHNVSICHCFVNCSNDIIDFVIIFSKKFSSFISQCRSNEKKWSFWRVFYSYNWAWIWIRDPVAETRSESDAFLSLCCRDRSNGLIRGFFLLADEIRICGFHYLFFWDIGHWIWSEGNGCMIWKKEKKKTLFSSYSLFWGFFTRSES